jgi:hypothetical protein
MENQMRKVILKLTHLVKNELIYNHKMLLNILLYISVETAI